MAAFSAAGDRGEQRRGRLSVSVRLADDERHEGEPVRKQHRRLLVTQNRLRPIHTGRATRSFTRGEIDFPLVKTVVSTHMMQSNGFQPHFSACTRSETIVTGEFCCRILHAVWMLYCIACCALSRVASSVDKA